MSRKRKTNKFFSRKNFLQLKKLFGRKINFTPKAFLVIGVFFFLLWSVNTFFLSNSLSFSTNVNLEELKAPESLSPEQIEIPSLNVNLPVEQTVIENMKWEVSEKGVSHLATSGYPTQNSNIIFYGHNTHDRLGRLGELKNDSIIRVKTKNGTIHFYKVYESKIVDPTDIDYLTQFSDETLTIYTCIGFADSKRLVVKAKSLI